MDIYLSEEEANEMVEQMRKNNTFPISTPEFPKEFMFDKVITAHSKKRYTGSNIVMKEGEMIQ